MKVILNEKALQLTDGIVVGHDCQVENVCED